MFNPKAVQVISRALPKDQIRQRQGKGGTFDYVPTKFVIRLLNEAFDFKWSTKILDRYREENQVIVLLELTVWTQDGLPVVKQQFGSSEVHPRQELGDCYKSAASDALKKAATLLGVGLELYDGVVVDGGSEHSEEPAKAAPAVPKPPTVPKPPAPPAASTDNPFKGVPKPPVSLPKPPPLPPMPTAPKATNTASVARPQPVAPPKANPFAPAKKAAVGRTGPNSTQLTALTNIATRRNLSEAELIALADVADEAGNPVTSFEELTYEQAITIIRAAQQ